MKQTRTPEERMDTLNLSPALQFIQRHLPAYKRGFARFMSKPAVKIDATSRVTCSSHKGIEACGPHVLSHAIPEILERMPETIQRLSMLKTVDYRYAGLIPVPQFEPDGSWKSSTVKMVSINEFPRKDDHPSRILIGCSDGNTIMPSALPECVHPDPIIRWYYQFHVFLHEYFHTVEFLRRSVEKRSEVILTSNSGTFTLSDWWEKWVKLYRDNPNPRFPSRYAETYGNDLVSGTEAGRFTTAIAEQICETFAGHQLDIAPNDEDEPDFRRHFLEGCHLIDELITARIA